MWVKRFIYFHNVGHPAEVAQSEINAVLTHLAVEKQVSASTQKQALSALLFLFRHVIGREVGKLGNVIRAGKPERLPVVMTREEVKTVLSQLVEDKRLMAGLMYGTALRLIECLRLRSESGGSVAKVGTAELACNLLDVLSGKTVQVTDLSGNQLINSSVIRELHKE